MIKGKEIVFIVGIIVITFISIICGIWFHLFLIILFKPPLFSGWPEEYPFPNNIFFYYLRGILGILVIIGPFFAIAGLLGLVWYQIFKKSLKHSRLNVNVKSKTKLLLYTIIIAMIIIFILNAMSSKYWK